MASTLRVVNLEDGKPRVDAAIRRLTYELGHTRSCGCTVLKIIHGYGSSGTGGRIRVESRAYLNRLKQQRKVKEVIPGEDFSIFNEATRKAFLMCGELRSESDLERHNNGVTYIVL